MIEFDEAEHIYTVDGQQWPSVTQVLNDMGLVKPYNGDPWYGERGTAIHAATVLMDNGTLDWDSVDPQIEGFLTAYHKFRDEQPFHEWGHTEERLSHSTYRYCGTPDRFLPLLDIKSGAGDVLQLEGYRALLEANGYDPGRVGYMLHLKEGGSYKLETHKYDRKLLGVFLSAVSVWWYRKGRGLL